MAEIKVTPIHFSRHPSRGTDISTVVMEYPRFIHSEILTHRVFARNSASSRAIPTKKMFKLIDDDPWIPTHWTLNKPGMSGDEVSLADAPLVKHPNSERYHKLLLTPNKAWQWASGDALGWAKAFDEAGYHKQISNRLIEPFMMIRVLVTATKWDNFFDLRVSKFAEPHFNELASLVYSTLKTATYVPRQYHLPYTDDLELDDDIDLLWRTVAGRCAGVSYQTVEDKPYTAEVAARVTTKLLEGKHMGPFEHLAEADLEAPPPKGAHWDRWGCFHDWNQFRSTLDGGNVG